MELNIREDKKLVNIWLTKLEKADSVLQNRLNELYKIQELLADYLEGAGRDNLQMIAENAYRKAKENYTWEQSAKKLLAFIDKIDAQERKCSEK